MKRTILVVLLSTMAATASAAPTCDIVGSITVPGSPAKGRRPAEPAKHAYKLADGSIIFKGRFAVDADGSPRAYHPDGVSGEDYLSNGGQPGNWWALATDAPNCGHTGAPLVQGSDDPNPGFYVSMTSLTDPSVANCRKQKRYVSSDAISYVGLPPAIAAIHQNQGNLVVVAASGGAGMSAIFADGAPKTGMGEGSMQLAGRLGLSASPKNGGTEVRSLTYLVLPNKHGFPTDETALAKDGDEAFRAWGGDSRLAVCRAALDAKPM